MKTAWIFGLVAILLIVNSLAIGYGIHPEPKEIIKYKTRNICEEQTCDNNSLIERLNWKIDDLEDDVDKYKDKYRDLKDEINFDYPNKTSEINKSELRELLEDYSDVIYFSDEVYGLTSKTQAKSFIKDSGIAQGMGSEEHDCDEYSFEMMGLWNQDRNAFAFGIVWSDLHAFNIMIDDKKQVWIVDKSKFLTIEEVQNDELYTPFRFIII